LGRKGRYLKSVPGFRGRTEDNHQNNGFEERRHDGKIRKGCGRGMECDAGRIAR